MTTRNVNSLHSYGDAKGFVKVDKDGLTSSLIPSRISATSLNDIQIKPNLIVRDQIIKILKMIAQLEVEILAEYQKLEEIIKDSNTMEFLKGVSS